MRRVFILPGRHQPPHNDHAEIIRRALELIGAHPLFIALIAGARAPLRPLSELHRAAAEHHRLERVPYTFAERAQLMQAMLRDTLSPSQLERVQVIALIRPELAWSAVTAIFPEQRTWIVPNCGEDFDDLKAAWFRARGDEVLRVRVTATTHGRLVRELATRRDPRLAEHVSPSVARILIDRKEHDENGSDDRRIERSNSEHVDRDRARSASG